jgi:eukaryotic-like serine/threonine-protein kinase
MLTGKRLFSGESVSDILAAILRQEPDLSLIPEKTRRIIARCLEKEPGRRLRDIGDARDLLGDERYRPLSRLGCNWIGRGLRCFDCGSVEDNAGDG